jgi:two-component system, cell cycle sensor histidine kinase and response regulator CckA
VIDGQGLVLLAEDEPVNRDMAEAMLKCLGYEVITACDGSEAVEIFRERKDEFGLALLDLSMPRMGGWETLNALRALRPEVPEVLANGYDEAKVMEGRQAELPQAFLYKPYRMVELKEALDAVMMTSAKRMKPD